LCCKAINDSNLFERAVFVYYDNEGNIVNFGQHGLDKTEANGIRRSRLQNMELLPEISPPKFRISKSYFITDGSIRDLEAGFPNISHFAGKESVAWKTGDLLIMPIGKLSNDKYEGLISVAYPFSTQRPPSNELILRLEEIIDMVSIWVSRKGKTFGV